MRVMYFCYDKVMTKSYETIEVIYNPNSTNDAEEKARSFQQKAKQAGYTVHLRATDHAGHARTLAAEIASKHKRALIISASGDGGYNEVINGVMDAKKNHRSHQPVVAIIAAGNANDHKRLTRGDTSLVTLLKRNKPRPLELLRITSKSLDRYAHSYIGLGITPEVGIELNRHNLNRWREALIVFHAFRKFTPFHILRDGKRHKLSSLIFANLPGMAKVIKLDTEQSSMGDGKFEVITFKYRGKFILLIDLLRSVVRGNAKALQVAEYTFMTTSKTPIQLDGEIETLGAKQEVQVKCMSNQIESLY